MKLFEITKGEAEAREEANKKAFQQHASSEVVAEYKNGHIQYALALKKLVHHGLSIEQAKQKLFNP